MSTILEEALEDAKLLKETAIKNAENVLVEAISPGIKEFVEDQIGGGIAEMPTYEAADEMPPLDDEEELEDEAFAFEAKGEDDDDKDDDDTMDEADEVVEITREDLQTALSELLHAEDLHETHSYQSGPDVTSGFADEQNPNTNATGGLGEKTAPGERGLEDKEKEEMWKDHEPPAASDWTVKEAKYRKYISALQKENKSLQRESKQWRGVAMQLKRNIQEVNLFNGKLLYTQKLLQNTNLTKEQRAGVIESFDRAESLREVELVYKSLSESFKIAGALVEGNKRRQRSSRQAGASGTSGLLSEQARAESGSTSFANRMQELAGILD